MYSPFERVNGAILGGDFEATLSIWLPGGRREGAEYVCADISGGSGLSFKVNINTGRWSEFAGDERGGDPVSLYAEIHGLTQGDAVRQLAQMFGVSLAAPAPKRAKSHKKTKKAGAGKKSADWTVETPVPSDAPDSDHAHWKHGLPTYVWQYKDRDDNLLYKVCRYIDENGDKAIRPVAYCRNPEGKGAWRYTSVPAPRPMYGLEKLAKAQGKTIVLVEGEKAADAFNLIAGERFLALTWPGGCKAIGNVDWTPLKNQPVIIYPDNDAPGFKAAVEIGDKLKAVGAKVKGIILPDSAWQNGADVADFPEWTGEKLAGEIDKRLCSMVDFLDAVDGRFGFKGKKNSKSQGDTLGDGPFRLEEDGVYFIDEDNPNRSPVWICSPLKILAKSRNRHEKAWGRHVAVKDPDGTWHDLTLRMADFSGSGEVCRKLLLDAGMVMAPGTKAKGLLQDYIMRATVSGRVQVVDRIGWHGDHYVLPDMVYGENAGDEKVVLEGPGESENAYTTDGDLEDWQEVARLYEGNSRLVFAVCMSFAGILLRPLGLEPGGINLYGPSSTGKSTILGVAASACGPGGINGFVKQWRTTDNALEWTALQRCDSLLILDEIGQVDGKIAGAIIYMLANGQGKGRSKRDGVGRKPFTWCLLFLSSGEITLADKIQEEKGGRVMGGQAVRVADIPIDAGAGMGAFENLHGYDTPALFAEALKDLAARFYGTAYRAFLEAFMVNKDVWIKQAEKEMKRFIKANCPVNADGQVKRVCNRFALIAAAGSLAIDAGILPWEAWEAVDAAKKCFEAWLEERGGVGSSEEQTGMIQVREFFQRHGSSRFEAWGADGEGRVIERCGYKRKNDQGDWDCKVPHLRTT